MQTDASETSEGPFDELIRWSTCAELPQETAVTQERGPERRRFIGMSLAAASIGIAAASRAAENVSVPSDARATYLVIYRAGPSWPSGAPIRALPLREHGRYMLELYRQSVLRFAGSFADDSGGAVMFDAENDAAARAIVDADPAVISGIFTFQLHRWALVPWAEIAKRAREQ
jgi:uncharacterized protein YciI